MKFKYLGTGAAEGWPSMFCTCENCRKVREAGGRNIRTRSQAVIDNRLLIDFPADTYSHVVYQGLPLQEIRSCIVTHSHSDHLYATDLEMRRLGFSHYEKDYPLTMYGTKPVLDQVRPVMARYDLEKDGRVFAQEITPFQPFLVENYTVTPLQADHDPMSGPVIYLISDGSKTVLYSNDTGYYPEKTWAYLEEKKPSLNFVSLDCTMGLAPNRHGHMGLPIVVEVRDRLKKIGCIDDSAIVCIHHFSHNGGVMYDEMVPLAKEHDMLVSYDGMELDI